MMEEIDIIEELKAWNRKGVRANLLKTIRGAIAEISALREKVALLEGNSKVAPVETRKVFNVNVGEMTTEEAMAYVQKVKDEIHGKSSE